MNDRRICTLCSGNIRYEDALEVAQVHSNVRRWKDFHTTVWRCPSCHSLHCLQDIDLTPFYETYPYSERRLDSWTRAVFRHYKRRLRDCGLDKASHVLDYGCSQGLFIEFLQAEGISACRGYDPYVERFNDERVLEKQYDFVIAQDVLEHVEDPDRLFSVLAGCVRPGGILCIGTPRADAIDFRDLESFIHSLHQPYHIHIFSESALLDLAVRYGLLTETLHRRHIFDTPLPFVNWTFILAYLEKMDNTLDAGFEPPSIATILTSPYVLLMGFLGYLFPVRSELLALFRKPA